MSEENKLIIGVDIGSGVDYSCSTSVCSNCRNVIDHSLNREGNEKVEITIREKCPHCGTKLNHIVFCGLDGVIVSEYHNESIKLGELIRSGKIK